MNGADIGGSRNGIIPKEERNGPKDYYGIHACHSTFALRLFSFLESGLQ